MFLERYRTVAVGLFDHIFYGYGDYFIRLIMVAWQREYHMLEVPVFYRLRLYGHSKNQFIATFIEYTSVLISLRVKLWLGRMK